MSDFLIFNAEGGDGLDCKAYPEHNRVKKKSLKKSEPDIGGAKSVFCDFSDGKIYCSQNHARNNKNPHLFPRKNDVTDECAENRSPLNV